MTFDPFDPAPTYLPTHDVTRMGDQNAEIGFTSAKLRAKGNVRWHDADGEPSREAKALLSARPAAR